MQKGCPKCGRLIDSSYEKCPYCNYDFSDINMYFKQVETKIIEENKYAGFIKRLIAGTIDINITLTITSLIMIIINGSANFKVHQSLFIFLPLFTLIYILYNALLERTKWQGAIGKKIVGIEVTDEYENPETIGRALIRNVVKFLNIFTFGIGFLTSAFPPNKQTLGDKITKNYVLSTINFNEEKNFEFGKPIKRLIAYIIDQIVISVIIVALTYGLTYAKENIKDLPVTIKNAIDWVIIIMSFVTCIFYFPIYESTKGKTIGKKTLHLKITDLDGKVINFQRAFIRQFLIVIDIINFGFLLTFTNKKKQTLKDKIMKTIVIDY